MKIDLILSRLDKVKRTGPDSWIACCCAHEDKSPSMTLREVEDGRILLHCFAGCSVEEILGALGLTFDALFPDKPLEQGKPLRRPFPAGDVLEALAGEAQIIAVIACDIGHGIMPDDAGRARAVLASERINEGRRLALG